MVLMFNIMNGECTLYENSNRDMKMEDLSDICTMIIHILKQCVQFMTATSGATMTMEKVLSLSESTEGIIIQLYSACLSYHGDKDTGKDAETYRKVSNLHFRLIWRPCHVAEWWVFKKIGLKGNQSLYQI